MLAYSVKPTWVVPSHFFEFYKPIFSVCCTCFRCLPVCFLKCAQTPQKSLTFAFRCLSWRWPCRSPQLAHTGEFGVLFGLFSKGKFKTAVFVCDSVFLLTATSLKEFQKGSVFTFQCFAYCLYYFKYQIPFRFIQVGYQFCKFYTVIAWFCYLVSYKQFI